jgi:hypothetical protein
VAFYCVNAVHFGKEPLRIEESEWPPMAEAIYHTGKPVIEYDETHRLRFNEDVTIDRTPLIGAWHPPLYLYTVAAAMVVTGDSPYLMRGVGAVGLFVAALLLLLIAREVTPRWREVGGVAAILWLIHPFAIQGSLFMDIDPSVYTPPALLVIWLAVRFAKRQQQLGMTQIAALGAAIALVLWTKMTTSIVLIGVLAVWWLLSRRALRRAAWESASFVGVGLVLFFSTYGLWCAVTDIPFSYTFDVTFVGKSNRLFSEWWLVNDAAHWHLRWLGAGVVLLGIVYLADLIRSFLSDRRLRPMDLPFLTGLGILILYVLLSPTDGTYQGKYAFPALPMILLSVSWMLLRDPTEARRPLQWGFAVTIGLVAALLLPDVLTGLAFLGDYGTWEFELRVVAAVAAALLLAWWVGGRPRFAGGVVVVLAMLLAVQTVHSYRADTSPMYPVPDTADFDAALNDLQHTLRRGDIAVAAKDIGFYLDGKVIEGEDAFARGDSRLATAIRRHPRIRAFARDSFGPPVGPQTEAVLQRCFGDVRIYGTATVAYRTESCSPRQTVTTGQGVVR